MDVSSQNTVAFLTALQDAMRQLRTIRAPSVRHGIVGGPFFNLHGREPSSSTGGLSLGLGIKGGDGRTYDLEVELLWNAERWTINSGIYVDADAGGQNTVRELPQRTTSDLNGCIEHLRGAIDDLIGLQDLAPGAN
jgi:hypothetical protein